ncbi:glycosyltransferase [Saccharopolyspora rosea]|uniref:glycosyltransferase n=1 Tax=Saccharopolyspora rosea TaxID=524884 RepID=UPI0021D814E8|nr:glycosyltransferase [Saccharopolyspora rosea]
MRALVYAWGTRGDVQPYLALGRALARAGHDTVLVAPARFAPLAAEHGIELAPWNDEALDLMNRPDVREMLAHDDQGGDQVERTRRFLREETFRLYGAQLDDLWRAASDGADVVVHSQISAQAIGQVAEKLRVPDVWATLYPDYAPSGYYPSPMRSPRWPRSRLANRLSHLRYRRARPDPRLRAELDRWRAGTLRLPPRRRRRRADSLLHCFSRHVLPPAPDWPSWVHTTGFWNLPRRPDWRPDEELERFLAVGEPPICVGFSSQAGNDPAGVGQRVLRAVRRVGVRAVVVTGWGGIEIPDPGPDVLVVDQVPFDWLFARVRAVVHPCGAGTFNLALAAGTPQVTCPFMSEQMWWAERLHRLGVCPEPIRLRDLTAESLAAALERALTDESVRRSAARMRERVRSEGGADAAVAVLERIVGRTGCPQ